MKKTFLDKNIKKCVLFIYLFIYLFVYLFIQLFIYLLDCPQSSIFPYACRDRTPPLTAIIFVCNRVRRAINQPDEKKVWLS